ncbi:MAG: ABC transporter substrate-binding protein [Anaerolineae bacterium]
MSKVNRRQFLCQTAMAATGLVIAACTKTPEPPPAATAVPGPTAVPAVTAAAAPTQAPPTGFKEAPMLAELVKAGKLPPVEERLPKNPKLVNEHAAGLLDLKVGKYGGTCRTGTTSPGFDAELFVCCNEPLINTPSILGKEFTPNILENYEVSADQKEFTFYLRPGLKWSDGHPVTTADVKFAIEDILFDQEYTATIPSWLRAANDPRGEPLKLQVIDDFTYKVTFDKPYGGFIVALAIQFWRGYTEFLKPAHYLKPYHKKYADADKLQAMIAEEKVENWVQLLARKDRTNWQLYTVEAIGFPSLYPWIIKEMSQDSAVFERNPYYFKVDAAGQQLPYLDRLYSWILPNQEMFTMKQIAGEIDYTGRFTVLTKLPLYKENEKNGYRVQLQRDHVTHSDFFLNLTYEDPAWRKVVRDKRFRQALNMAIDREEILDAVYYGYGEMPTIVPAEYDPKKAEQLLDEMGMKKGADGFRTDPDGQPFMIPFEYSTQDPTFGPAVEIVTANWKQIGINTSAKMIDSQLWGQRNNANQLQATVLWSEIPLWYWGGLAMGLWAPLWWRWWNSEGQDGEEPPEEVKAFYQKMNEIVVVPAAQGPSVFEEAKKMVYENVWFMPPLENIRQAMIVNAKFGNVPQDPSVMSIAFNFSMEQVYLES